MNISIYINESGLVPAQIVKINPNSVVINFDGKLCYMTVKTFNFWMQHPELKFTMSRKEIGGNRVMYFLD